jgi:hypothetical protein
MTSDLNILRERTWLGVTNDYLPSGNQTFCILMESSIIFGGLSH